MSEIIYSAAWLVLTISIGVLVVSFLPAEQRTSGYLGGIAQAFGVGVAVECILLAGLVLIGGVSWGLYDATGGGWGVIACLFNY